MIGKGPSPEGLFFLSRLNSGFPGPIVQESPSGSRGARSLLITMEGDVREFIGGRPFMTQSHVDRKLNSVKRTPWFRLVLTGLASGGILAAFTGTVIEAVASSVKQMVAQYGSCIPDMDIGKARQILSENGISAPGAQEAEVRALARTVQQINLAKGERYAPLQNVNLRFSQSAYNPREKRVVNYSFQLDAKTVHMCRGNHAHVGNVGYLAHELGHVVGNGGGLYAGYKAQVNPPCHVSTYATVNYTAARARNEEFAESFAAFIANPSILEKTPGEGCKKALAFFKEKFPNVGNGCEIGSTILDQSSPDAPINFDPVDHSSDDQVLGAIGKANDALGKPSGIGQLIGSALAMAMQWFNQPTPTPTPGAPVPVLAPPPPVEAPAARGGTVPSGQR